MLYNQLKEAASYGLDIPLDKKTYVAWTEAELEALVVKFVGETFDGIGPAEFAAALPEPEPERPAVADLAAVPTRATPPAQPTVAAQRRAQAASGEPVPPRDQWGKLSPSHLAQILGVPLSDRNAERAGLTFNTHGPDDPLRIDSLGRVWYMDEVQKPAIPKARMTRKVKSISNNVVVQERRDASGHLEESFEVAGEVRSDIEIKITLPSMQVGIYFDPRMPFKIHQYNGRRGFDYNEIRDFYGGLDLVPSSIQSKTMYVGTDLCFDMNAVRDTMERELRDRQLGRSEY
jgi:hypothetical protein